MTDREIAIALGFYGLGIFVGLYAAHYALAREFAAAEAREQTRRELYATLTKPRSETVVQPQKDDGD